MKNIMIKYYVLNACMENDNSAQIDRELLVQKEISYDESTTFKELLTRFGFNNFCSKDIFPYRESRYLSYYYDNENGSRMIVHHVYQDGKIKWHVNVSDCRVVALLNTYDLNEIVLYRLKYYGGLGAAGGKSLTWDKIKKYLEKLLMICSVYVTFHDFPRAIGEDFQVIKSAFSQNENGEVTPDEFGSELKKRTCWSEQEVRFVFSLDDMSKDSLKYLMRIYGYLYDSKTELFFYSQDIEEKYRNEVLELDDDFDVEKVTIELKE